MEKPVVSVLLASFNHEKYVEEAVRSVMAQKGVPFELLVIDDGSTDSSPHLLEKLSKEFGFRYCHRENRGFVNTLNELLSEAQGDFFCTFASDDVMAPGRLAMQSDYLKSHPEKIACFGMIQLMDESGHLADAPDPRYTRSVPEVTFEEFFLGKKELHGCSEMIRRVEFQKMGGYDSKYPFEDFPLWLKLLKKYGSLPVLPCVCTHYRVHGNNMSSDGHLMYGTFLKVIESYRNEPLFPRAWNIWRSHWFSNLAFYNKKEALRRLPQLASFSLAFFRRFPKLFIPRRFLKR